MVRVTFTFDEEAVATLRLAARRPAKPQNAVVREALRECAARAGRLSEEEQVRLLQAFDTLVPRIPGRPAARVDAELGALRAARRRGGRRHAAAAGA